MTRIKRSAGLLATGLLLGFTLTACGGGDAADAPTNASKDEFCDVFNSSQEGDSELTEESFEEVQDMFAELGDIGTPKEIEGDAREGFELLVDAVADMSFDEAQEMEESTLAEFPGMDKEESDKVLAFFTESFSLCVGDIGEQMGELEDQMNELDELMEE